MKSRRFLTGLLVGITLAGGMLIGYWRQSDWRKRSWLQQDWIEVTASTGCHPIPLPGEDCPGALSFDELLQLRGTLDMCEPHAWTQIEGIKDAGVGFQAKASMLSPEAMGCLDRFLTKNAKISRRKH